MLTARSQSEAGSTGLPDCGDSIDQLTFEQILEMDDDEDEREFSRSIVYGFFEQAEQTFKKMDTSLYVHTSLISPSCSCLLSFFSVAMLSRGPSPDVLPERLPKLKNTSECLLNSASATLSVSTYLIVFSYLTIRDG